MRPDERATGNNDLSPPIKSYLTFIKKYDIIYIQKVERKIKPMYICPTCEKQFHTEEVLTKHFLKCWKDKNPNHKSKSAPRSEDINTREVCKDVLDFFNSFK